jgi:hypothetical protein
MAHRVSLRIEADNLPPFALEDLRVALERATQDFEMTEADGQVVLEVAVPAFDALNAVSRVDVVIGALLSGTVGRHRIVALWSERDLASPA